jgi:hypothetical protein
MTIYYIYTLHLTYVKISVVHVSVNSHIYGM